MRTLDFKDVVYGTAQLAGLDRDNLPGHFFKQVRDFANTRLAIAWETEYWPETMKIVERTVTTSNDISTMDYPTDAGEVLEIYSKNPKKTTNLDFVSYVLHDTGADSDDNVGKSVVVYSTTTPLFMEYKKARPELIGDVNVTTALVQGDQIYSDGNFWEAKTARNAGTHQPIESDGTVDSTNWSKILIPKIFQNYLIRGIYSDYLRANGQLEAASIEDNNANGMLVMESDKLYRQQGQVRTTKMVTY